MAATVAGIHLGPDTHANRPAASAPPVGTFYYCSDHDLVYITDGSTWTTWLDNTGVGGSVATDALFDAKGDLPVGTGVDAADNLAAGADYQYLRARAAANAMGLEWVAEAGRLLAYVQYRPATQQVLSRTGATTYADADATNLVIAFTGPSTGNVLVRLTGAADQQTAGMHRWNLRDGSGDIAGTDGGVTTLTAGASFTRAIPVTGLTPGTAYSWKWGISTSDAAHTARLIVSDGDPYPPAVMEVWVAP